MYINVASLEYEAGLLESSSTMLHDGLELARRYESSGFVDWLSREFVLTSYERGAWDESLQDARDALAVSRERGEPHMMDVPVTMVQAAILAAREGRLLEAEIAHAVERARAVGDPQIILPALGEAALVLVDAGRCDEARCLLDELRL